ncbi:nicotinate-nucleotide adenylyltransferase [Enterobacteriaceae bacterium LUAb1]
MPETSSLLALFGGTFDPIHYGHLKSVTALAQEMGLQQVILLPNNVPPHRPQPKASAVQRVKMIELAIADLPLFTLDTRELQQQTPSYTVHTLEQLRFQQGPQQPLAFIIGQDSLLTLHTWYRWQDLLSLCHLLVLKRPGYPLEMKNHRLQQWLHQHRACDITQLNQSPAGYIWLANTPMIDISASEIRKQYHQGGGSNHYLPQAIQDYINNHDVYRDT